MDFDNLGTAIGTIRQAYDLIAIMAKDAARFLGKFRKVDLKRFHEVYMPEIQQKLHDSVSAYVTDFGQMERHLLDEASSLTAERLAAELSLRNDRMWSVKAAVESQARTLLAPLPPASLERAYVWAVLNVYFGDTVGKPEKTSMIQRADDIANQVSDEELDTPNTRIVDRIKSGGLRTHEDLIETIRSEKADVIARFKIAQRLYEEISIGAAMGRS